MIVWIVCMVLFLLCNALWIALARFTVFGRRQTMEESWNWELEHCPNCRDLRREEFTDYGVTASDGYKLHCSYYPAKQPSNLYVILVHGYTDTRWGMLKYLQFYRDMNIHCILYDQRGHGENTKAPCTYSLKEQTYLKAVYEDALQRFGAHIRIGIHGESLGGATVLGSMQYHLPVEFYVDDCGFAEIIPVLKVGLGMMHLPKFLVYGASLWCKICFGYFFGEAKPIQYVRDNTVPLLIMHGAKDDFILPEHSKRVYEMSAGYKELHFFEGASHAESAIVCPLEYKQVLEHFLQTIHFLDEKSELDV